MRAALPPHLPASVEVRLAGKAVRRNGTRVAVQRLALRSWWCMGGQRAGLPREHIRLAGDWRTCQRLNIP
ncbi:hypothetical protein ACNKHU_13165 [Shigella flexneri]